VRAGEGGDAPAPGGATGWERPLVDVDPWGALLEALLEPPEGADEDGAAGAEPPEGRSGGADPAPASGRRGRREPRPARVPK
jgi:hypothetical protein